MHAVGMHCRLADQAEERAVESVEQKQLPFNWEWDFAGGLEAVASCCLPVLQVAPILPALPAASPAPAAGQLAAWQARGRLWIL